MKNFNSVNYYVAINSGNHEDYAATLHMLYYNSK